jgi:hypothetical protein
MSEQKNQALVDMVGEAARYAPLVIVTATDDKQSPVHGKLTRVFLNGQDISRFTSDVEVMFDVERPVGARITYIGAAVIVAEGAEVTLKQADIHVRCSECDGTTRGERQEAQIVDVTPFGATTRRKALAEPVSA